MNTAVVFSLSFSPVRVREYGPERTRGDKSLQTKVSSELDIKSLRGEPRGSLTCNMPPPCIIVEEFWRKNCQSVIPTCSRTATFPVSFSSKIRLPIRQRIPGNRCSRPSFRWACNPICKSKLRLEESVFRTLDWEQMFATNRSRCVGPICGNTITNWYRLSGNNRTNPLQSVGQCFFQFKSTGDNEFAHVVLILHTRAWTRWKTTPYTYPGTHHQRTNKSILFFRQNLHERHPKLYGKRLLKNR